MSVGNERIDKIFKQIFQQLVYDVCGVIRVRQAFQLARCGCTLRVTPQTSYSPEYITPTHTKSLEIFF
jgi:hypothetical protein